MPTARPRILFAIDPETQEKIQDIRFTARFNSQAEVVRYLVDIGLEQVMSEMETPDGIEKLRKRLESARENGLDKSDCC
jgi:Arc/MetJ-type ribon-helix-helix transcriptional regulator